MSMDIGRRRCAKLLAGLAALATSPVMFAAITTAAGSGPKPAMRAANAAPRRSPAPLIKPRRLARGAVVGLIAPGGVVDDAIIETCVRNLESVGFTVKPGANLRAAHGGYAGTVEQRLDDLHRMFADREVQAIWTARGGSGCTALLPHIRYDLLRRQPKILIGYSDITALHIAIHRHAGIVTFHGPVAWSTFSEYSVRHMLAVLMEPQPEYTIAMAPENAEKASSQPEYALRTLHPGVAEGRLVGGNLSVLAALIGTPYAADIRNRLLFLEDVGEAPYRIDRMLAQLQQSQGLRAAAGVMLGVFRKSASPAGEPSLTLDEILDEHFAKLPLPSVYGYSFGHVAQQFTLPVGIRARLDTAGETLRLLESAVQ